MDSKKTGEFIAKMRKEKRITQSELADLLGVTNKAVSRWETGEGFPEITFLPQLAKILNVTSDEILLGESSNNVTDISSTNKKYSLKFKTFTLISILLIVVTYFISIITAYHTYYEWIGLLVLLIGLSIGSILYIYGRYTFLRDCIYLDEDKILIHKCTSFVYLALILVLGLFAPLIFLDPNLIYNETLPTKTIIKMGDYIGWAFLGVLISYFIYMIVYIFHSKIILKKISPIFLSIVIAFVYLIAGFLVIGIYQTLEIYVYKNQSVLVLILLISLIFSIILLKKFIKFIIRLGFITLLSSLILTYIFIFVTGYNIFNQLSFLFEYTNVFRLGFYFLGAITYFIYLFISYKNKHISNLRFYYYLHTFTLMPIIYCLFIMLDYDSNKVISHDTNSNTFLLFFINILLSSTLFIIMLYKEKHKLLFKKG